MKSILLISDLHVGCYDKETEILTSEGWKLFKDLNKKEKVAQFNEGYMEFVSPSNYFEYDYDGELYSFKNGRLDLMVTPNHILAVIPQWKFKEKGDKKLQLKRADEVGSGTFLQSAKWKGKKINEVVIPHVKGGKKEDTAIDGDTFMAFLGIYLAEGYTTKWHSQHTVGISQYETSKYYEDIEDLLKTMPFHFNKQNDRFRFFSKPLWNYFRQFGKSGDKFVPTDVKNATPKQIKIFLEWYIKGDGHIEKGKNGRYNIYLKSKSKRLIDDVQEMFLKINRPSYLAVDKKGYFYLLVRRGRKIENRPYASIDKNQISKEDYKGKVYCVEVPSHLIIVRRKGKICISGNSVFAVFPKGHKTRHQNLISLNPLQNELYELWMKMSEDVQKENYDYVFLLGDLIDGLNTRGAGRERVVNNLNEQMDAALKLLHPLCKGKENIGITSSPYHNSADYEVDREICKRLHGHFLGTIANVRVRNTNKVINIGHGAGGSGVYHGTKASKDILSALSSERLEKIPNANIICRAHHHSYLHLEMDEKHMIWCPCFEGQRLNTYSMGHYQSWAPDIGVVKIGVSDDAINVVPFIYKLKHERKNIKVI